MKKSIIFVSAVLVVVFISAFTLNNTTLKGYGIGDVADDFLLKNIDENMVSLADYKDAKGFIITFTCNTCPFAVMYEDRIQALNEKYASQGYPVIAIMPNNTDVKPGDALPEMKKRAEEKGFTFPYLLDEEQNVYPKFGATKTPHIFVLEKTKKGNVVKYIGAIDDNHKDASAVKVKFVENAVNALLKGEEVGLKETKAIGCSIKV
ncbi:thioredoxin family protein [uncultured Algibacter sp.]|uniref:thioredoxin family protein n=1 Tax=uncultured Algibacter sp. TaxID=298659 RepID=UPI0030EC41CE|tara:strand:- start:897 stop:1514 length:618 start_codon:yes stop_codon:yes gene_type:complete